MADTLARPQNIKRQFKKVALLFSGGPAPSANAVISTAAVSFLRSGCEVVGIKNGYSRLMEYNLEIGLEEGADYIKLDHTSLKRSRNTRGILIGTARANPGKDISSPAHLEDASRTAPMRTVYDALRSIGVEALVSIGGDDTLKTANKFRRFQDTLPEDCPRLPVVHVPKTIDNDYSGIDFTFGYFSAVEVIAGEIRNVLADAETDGSYFICESMGRSAGWLAYGAAIAGEASLAISVEDITGPYATQEEVVDTKTGEKTARTIMNIDAVVDRIVSMMEVREKEGKAFGVIVVAEGLAEYFSAEKLKDVPRDAHGHIAVAELDLGKMFAKLVKAAYEKKINPEGLDPEDPKWKSKKVKGLQFGYEARCVQPTAFDVMLGSQLGVGAFRALSEQGLDSVMVSVKGQFDLHYVDFDTLIDKETMVTVVRFVNPNSDFHKLTRFLETSVND
ncbi:MAG: 6-phosphofructokinase [Planctomycetaceae bacterium]|nr:6-phosphofructokinase [Planctomycetaceae bacterium]